MHNKALFRTSREIVWQEISQKTHRVRRTLDKPTKVLFSLKKNM